MRVFVALAFVVLGMAYFHQRNSQTAVVSPPPTSRSAVESSPSATAQPHWPKAAINRAQDVVQEVKRERASNAAP